MADYVRTLKADLIEQFKDRPNIAAVMEAVGDQLQEVAVFFEDLRTQCNLQTAVGTQLDGEGDIVVLSRGEAGEMASISNPGVALTDEEYRRFLKYKVLRNTNNCTYREVIKSFGMFWHKPLYYSEDPREPAIMLFNTGMLTPEDDPQALLNAPIIRAAGVGVHVTATTENPEMESGVYISAAMGRGMMESTLPELVPEYDLNARLRSGAAMIGSIMSTRLPVLI